MTQGVLPPEIDENRELQASFLSFGIVVKALRLTPDERAVVKVEANGEVTFGQGCDDVVDDILMSDMLVKPEIDLFEDFDASAKLDFADESLGGDDKDDFFYGNDLPDVYESDGGENVAEMDKEPLVGHKVEVHSEESEDEKPLLRETVTKSGRKIKLTRKASFDSDGEDFKPTVKIKKENIAPKLPKKRGRKRKKKIVLTSDESDAWEPPGGERNAARSESDDDYIPEEPEEVKPKAPKLAKKPKEPKPPKENGVAKGPKSSGRLGKTYKKDTICKICGEDFTGRSRKSWYNHKVSHRRLPCVKCGRNPDNRMHRKTSGPHHDNSCNYVGCGVTFTTWDEHQAHVTAVHGGLYYWQCGKCAALFPTQATHKLHRREVHKKKLELKQCSICGLKVMNMKGHVEARHGTEKFPCELCGKMFDTRQAVNRHHDKRNCPANYERVSCQDCGKVFNNKHTLRRHWKQVHTPDHLKPHVCTVCGKGFIWKFITLKWVGTVIH